MLRSEGPGATPSPRTLAGVAELLGLFTRRFDWLGPLVAADLPVRLSRGFGTRPVHGAAR